LFDNQRPGVYSRYDITGFYGLAPGARDAAVVLSGGGAQSGVLHSFSSYAEALSAFGGNAPLSEALRLLFAGGAGKVHAAVAGGDYAGAFSLLEGVDTGALVCDCREPDDLAALREFLEKSAERQRECIAFLGIGDPEEAIAAAEVLNCERAAICCPAVDTGEAAPSAVFAACALAGRVLAAPNPIYNLSGDSFELLYGAQSLPEETVQRLLRAGVCVFEETGGEVELIRALTTRASTAGAADYSLRSLNTVLIIDDVMRSIRLCLRRRLKGTGAVSASGIRDQITVELAEKADAGIISDFAPPKVAPDKSDPAVCVVALSFSAAHLPSRIHITAHVRV